MVDGYESTVTLADGLAAMHVLWIVVGFVLAGLGTNALLLDAGEPSTLLRGARAGAGLVLVMTAVVWVYWANRSWSNLARIGREARLTLSTIVPRYLGLLAVAVVVGGVALGTEQYRRPAGAIAGVALIGASAAFPVLARHLLRTFWVAGAAVGVAPGSPPAVLKVWVLTSWKLVWLLVLSGMGGLDSHEVGTASVLTGVVAVVFGGSGFRLMPAISARFDERLDRMIADPDGTATREETPVVSEDFGSTWADSEGLVDFRGH